MCGMGCVGRCSDNAMFFFSRTRKKTSPKIGVCGQRRGLKLGLDQRHRKKDIQPNKRWTARRCEADLVRKCGAEGGEGGPTPQTLWPFAPKKLGIPHFPKVANCVLASVGTGSEGSGVRPQVKLVSFVVVAKRWRQRRCCSSTTPSTHRIHLSRGK